MTNPNTRATSDELDLRSGTDDHGPYWAGRSGSWKHTSRNGDTEIKKAWLKHRAGFSSEHSRRQSRMNRRRTERQEQASQRQQARDQRSSADQLRLLRARGHGNCAEAQRLRKERPA